MTTNAPDFTHSGQPITWPSDAEVDEHFAAAISAAQLNLGIDVELVRWDPEWSEAGAIRQWWSSQRLAVVRDLIATGVPKKRIVVRSRRHAGDGAMIGYIRVERPSRTISTAPAAAVAS
jgi:hypothetical protein